MVEMKYKLIGIYTIFKKIEVIEEHDSNHNLWYILFKCKNYIYKKKYP